MFFGSGSAGYSSAKYVCLFGVLVGVLWTGCVSKKKYVEIQNQYEARGEALAAMQAELQESQQQVDQLNSDLEIERQQRELLYEEYEVLQSDYSKLREDYEGLSAPSAPVADRGRLNFPTFDLPPPPYSKTREFPVRSLFPAATTYGDVDAVFSNALRRAGYIDQYAQPRFYYFQLLVDGEFRGYAVVTDFEQISADGRPTPRRFDLRVNKNKYKSWIERVFPFWLDEGYFRFFAFLITDDYYSDWQPGPQLTKNQVIDELLLGAKSLHPAIAAQPISANANLHVLVYEYRQTEAESDGHPTELDDLSVAQHLIQAGLWNQLNFGRR
jgi:hypothetical protein